MEDLTQKLQQALQLASRALLNERVRPGLRHWEGELSTSALSTATAVMALFQYAKSQQARGRLQKVFDGKSEGDWRLIEQGLAWLLQHQNADGGWGDTDKSLSNISTTMLAHATLVACREAVRQQSPVLNASDIDAAIERSGRLIEVLGGIQAIRDRYGKDHTFSVPILTHAALAGLVSWNEIPALPYELALLPHRFFEVIQLPVVSYALPALIAIGQTLHLRQRTWNPWWWVRRAAIPGTLQKLQSIQPESGGFLEATPLTSFVTMCLASVGRVDHPVTQAGLKFIRDSVRPDGSWPIDTNLATWVTTLSINHLGAEAFLPDERDALRRWLLQQQYRTIHPYTNAAPGGWAWTNLSGGVPDADDTPGAMLALMELDRVSVSSQESLSIEHALHQAALWLIKLQNRDGGWPTFCRGWGALPFDRSSNDITAHCLRALIQYERRLNDIKADVISGQSAFEVPAPEFRVQMQRSIQQGFEYLEKTQREDGSWLPLWFGNQHSPDDENPLYGTSRVLLAYADAGLAGSSAALRGCDWLVRHQHANGAWGPGTSLETADTSDAESDVEGEPASTEETALALMALCRFDATHNVLHRGASWLIAKVENETWREPTPIGFYFAKLWYYEKLYPQVFTVGALKALALRLGSTFTSLSESGETPSSAEPTSLPIAIDREADSMHLQRTSHPINSPNGGITLA